MNDQRIAVLTDTGSDCPAEFAAAHDVRVVPLRINYSDGSSYESGVDITTDEVVERFEQEVPKTSLPSPERIADEFARAKADGYKAAVFVSISSGLSATCDTVRMVARTMEDFPVVVVDTLSIGVAAGLVVMEAVRQVEEGVPLSDLEQTLGMVARNTNVFFTVRDLEYLRRGGRITETIYRLGSVLNIKPVLTCDEEGHYVIAKKARGWDRALDTMVSLVAEKAHQYKQARLAVCCSSTTRDLYDALEQKLRAAIPNVESVQRHDLSADLLVHTGPEMAGMGVQNAELDF